MRPACCLAVTAVCWLARGALQYAAWFQNVVAGEED